MAIIASKSTFSEGLSKDSTTLKQASSTYTDALDIRVVTDHGSTGEAVINIEGNEYMDVIPTIPDIILIDPNKSMPLYSVNYPNNSWSITVSLTIDGNIITSQAYNGTSAGLSSRTEGVMSLLQNDPAFTLYNLNVVSSGDRIRVWSDTHSVTLFTDDGPAQQSYSSTIYNSTLQSTISGSSQTIIGWENVRDVLYIITTNNASSTGGNGTVWSMQYDHSSFAATWSLIYSSNDMLMTTQHPIANPSAIEAAYENDDYLRIAFTDFFNPLRILNIYDDELMAIAPAQFSLDSGGVRANKPIFKNVGVGGSLYTGMHQIASRYRTSSGGYSIISPISNMVTVVDEEEDNDFPNYEGAQQSVQTGKALEFEFNDIDTSYDFLEIIHIFRDSKFGQPSIDIIAEIPTPTSSLTYIVTGNEDRVSLTLDSFIDIDKPFTHAKTISQKDNILFAGNVYKEAFDIDFDATAIRYDNNGQPHVSTPQHPDQNYFQYQQDGVIVGGTGDNISYKIITKSIDGDARNPGDVAFPHRIINPIGNSTVNIGGDSHYWGDHFGYYGSPWIQGLARSYKRGETYRFGFVPIRNGQDGRVKYIGDIQMPWAMSQGGIFNDFKLLNSGGPLYTLNAVGLEFTVDISSIQSEIDSFRIVRVERTEADRTMLGGGLLSPMMHRVFSDKPGYYLAARKSFRPTDNWMYSTNTNTGASTDAFSWHCPDYLFGKPFDFRPGDELVVTHNYESIDQVQNAPSSGPSYNVDRIKLYEEHPSIVETVQIEDAVYCSRASQVTLDGQQAYNMSAVSKDITTFTAGGAYGDSPLSNGTDTIFIKTLAAGLGQTYNNNVHSLFYKKHYAEYRRPNVDQYGGTSDAAKANNVYIDCGALKKISDTSQPIQTLEVWGGDTYVTIWDTLKMYRNFDIDDSEDPNTFGIIIYSPIETDINLDIRHGDRTNNLSHTMDPTGTVGATPNDFEKDGEDFLYNYAYSAENNLKTFLPEPLTGEVNEEYSERIYASLTKAKGEIVDSWRDFRPDSMIDLEGNYGPINALINNSDTLFAIQDRAFGKASVNERATISTTEGSSIALGTTGVLSRFDYITTHAGSKHQFGIVNSPTSIYFFDVINGELYRFSGGRLAPISSLRGLKAFFYDSTRGSWMFDNDNPIFYDQVNINQPGVHKGITGTYDYRYDEVILTFHSSDEDGNYSPFTIGYDEENNKFTSFYSFKPSMYINDGFSIISPAPVDFYQTTTPGLYVHNAGVRGVFYGGPSTKSRIEILVNQLPERSKIFTNLEWNSIVRDSSGNDIPLETITDIKVSTDYQETAVSSTFKRRFRTWRHKIGRDSSVGDRIMDHSARLLMSYQNSDDKKLILNDITTVFDSVPMITVGQDPQ